MEHVAITLEGRTLRLVQLADGGVDLRADEGPPGRHSVFERLDLSHGRIALRVADGRYVARHVEHAGKPTDSGAVITLVDELTQCAAFEEVHLPGGYLSLRGCDLRFLGVHTSGRVVADRVSNGTWERFRYVELPAPQAVEAIEAIEAIEVEARPLTTPMSPGLLPAVAPAASGPLVPGPVLGGSAPAGRSVHLSFLAAV